MVEQGKILRPFADQAGKGNGGDEKSKMCPFRSAGFMIPKGGIAAVGAQEVALHIMSGACLKDQCMMWSKKDEWCNLLLRNA